MNSYHERDEPGSKACEARDREPIDKIFDVLHVGLLTRSQSSVNNKI